jgi:hypothetical protein
MIKYSLQNECLENIEAFTDEQISREMAVIESVLEIYNKTILMMELSNSDVDLPDCSMFMESTFFQESDEGEGGASAADAPKEGEPAKQPAQGDGKDNSGETKKPMTEEERKAYNKEHWVRMKTKDGKTENIFISIIAFIPRLLGYLIQCVVKFFKKLFNKKADDTVKKGSKAAQGQSSEELDKTLGDDSKSSGGGAPGGGTTGGGGTSGALTSATSEAGGSAETSTAGKMDTKTKMWNWYDVTKILDVIESIDKVLQSLSTANMDAIGQFGKALSDENDKLTAVLKGRVQMDGDRVVDSKNNLLNKLNGLKASAEKAEESIQEFVKSKRSGAFASFNGNVQDAKGTVTTLKNVIKSLTTIMTAVGTAYGKTYEEASKILKKAGARDIGEVQNTDSSQPPVNTEGGEG